MKRLALVGSTCMLRKVGEFSVWITFLDLAFLKAEQRPKSHGQCLVARTPKNLLEKKKKRIYRAINPDSSDWTTLCQASALGPCGLQGIATTPQTAMPSDELLQPLFVSCGILCYNSWEPVLRRMWNFSFSLWKTFLDASFQLLWAGNHLQEGTLNRKAVLRSV